MKKLPRVRMGELGVSASAARKFLMAAEKCGLHSFILTRRGQVACEGWWKPFAPSYPHMLHSLSKSFTSTAFGFAVQEGLVSPEDFVADFFPEYLPCSPCENMKKMRIRHLLTMNTGHAVEPEVIRAGRSCDWMERFLQSYVPNEPGSGFLYNTAATYMVSAIVQRVTGQTVCDYLKPRLFDPLGFGEYWWDTCPKGVNTGGFGLNVTTEDIAKFGNFLLNRGAFDGKQLLNPDWIDLATSRQVSNEKDDSPDWRAGYGYQFWQCAYPDTYRGDGAYGQYCIVNREKELVFACTARVEDMQEEINLVYRYLFDPLRDEVLPPCEDEAAFAAEAAALSMAAPAGEAHDSLEAKVSDRTYDLAPNDYGLKTVRFHFGDNTALSFGSENGFSTLSVGYGRFAEGSTCAPVREGVLAPMYREAACAGAWQEGRYRLRVLFTRTTTEDNLTVTFLPHGIRIEMDRTGCFIGRHTELCGILRA